MRCAFPPYALSRRAGWPRLSSPGRIASQSYLPRPPVAGASRPCFPLGSITGRHRPGAYCSENALSAGWKACATILSWFGVSRMARSQAWLGNALPGKLGLPSIPVPKCNLGTRTRTLACRPRICFPGESSGSMRGEIRPGMRSPGARSAMMTFTCPPKENERALQAMAPGFVLPMEGPCPRDLHRAHRSNLG